MTSLKGRRQDVIATKQRALKVWWTYEEQEKASRLHEVGSRNGNTETKRMQWFKDCEIWTSREVQVLYDTVMIALAQLLIPNKY